MDAIERELRRKLGGLRISQSRTMTKLHFAGKGEWAKQARAKLKEVDKACKVVERQIEAYLKQKKTPPRTATIKEPGAGRHIAVVGDVYRFLATGEETKGKYALWEAIVPPGGGPPPHIHSREEEGFLVLEGEITFTIGNERLVATAGTFANMPVGTMHTFKNESGRAAKMLISVAPAGLEKMFFEVGQAVASGATTAPPPTKEEIDKLLAVAPRYGIEILLPGH